MDVYDLVAFGKVGGYVGWGGEDGVIQVGIQQSLSLAKYQSQFSSYLSSSLAFLAKKQVEMGYPLDQQMDLDILQGVSLSFGQIKAFGVG